VLRPCLDKATREEEEKEELKKLLKRIKRCFTIVSKAYFHKLVPYKNKNIRREKGKRKGKDNKEDKKSKQKGNVGIKEKRASKEADKEDKEIIKWFKL